MINNNVNFQKKIALAFGGFVLMVFGAIFFGLVVMLLWNWIMPIIFNLPEITYWQAWGLFLLSKILFGGRRVSKHYGGSHGKMRGRYDRKKVRAKIKKWMQDSKDEDNELESSES